MDTYNIRVSNCNSIEHAEITITKGQLNIKYGPNGLGKSTIAKSIAGKARADGSLDSLTPFKCRGVDGAPKPNVDGVEGISTVLAFDEEYINQFAFQRDEVLKNSFDIFIKTDGYIKAMAEIEGLFSGVRKTFDGNAEIDAAISDLKELRDAFGSSKTGAIPKTSKVHKAFGSGNKLENIPGGLEPYTSFIRSDDPSKWIGWQIKGNEFLKIADSCPYCSTDLIDDAKKETVLSVEKEYDAKSIEHLNQLKAIIDRLGKYFSEDCQANLEKVSKAKVDLTAEERTFLTTLKTEIEAFIEKLEGLRSISFFSLRDVDSVDEKVRSLKIDLTLIGKLNSTESQSITDPINSQLEDLLLKVGILKGSINKQKAGIENSITENQDSINSFLKSAGYKYKVEITPESDSYKMKLVHQDSREHIEAATRHLSYGEKNAFALVLFMHQVISEKPDLTVLDDPISSFDKNKKFAILHQLFHGKASLRGRTILMLTHDIEPIIDMIKSGVKRLFEASKPSAAFLHSSNGVIKEIPIERGDVQTFAKICSDNIATLTDQVIKAIYLRRHYEILDDLGVEYNLLASLLKGREKPTWDSDGSIFMSDEERSGAELAARNHIPDFDYDSILSEIKDPQNMRAKFLATSVGYEKIQVFRILYGQHENSVITKFINESYHIENEYMMQLNPHKFDNVPEYVIEECSSVIATSDAA